MNTSLVALAVFLALASALAALAFLVRDVVLAVAATKETGGRVRLRRLNYLPEDPSSQGPVAGFDRWFVRLVGETGLRWTPTTAALLVMLSGLIAGGAIFVGTDQVVPSSLGAMAAMAAALVFLAVRRARRVGQLQQQLPAALDMLGRSMRAGLSLEDAVELVGSRFAEPLAAEFRFCSKQLAMGLSLQAVMRSLVQRVRLMDVKIFTTTLSVHRQTGGNVARVLERLAAVIRDRLNCRRQLKATTGAGRLSAMLIAAIGPLLFLYLMAFQPQYAEVMLESPLGQTMLVGAVALELIGLVWTARLLKPVY